MRGLDKQLLVDLCTTSKTDPKIVDDVLIVSSTLDDGSKVELTLDIAVETFYKLPEFSADLDCCPNLKGLPHVGASGTICASDATLCQPNPEQPEKCVSEILERTVAVLNNGITGKNYDDYADELNAYWLIDGAFSRYGYVCDALLENTGIIYRAYANMKGATAPCFAANEQTAIDFAKHLGKHHNHTTKATPCLFLSLSCPLSFPLPITYKDWDEEIKRSGKQIQNVYRSFLCKNKKKSVFVVLSVPSKSGKCTVCFRQDTTPDYGGFRPLPKRHERALKNSSYGNKAVEKYFLEDISQERLFSRGGNGQIMQGCFGIIGCGSLGSNLAKTLADAGASKFLLIDNETLDIENIARHTCGFDWIGKNKSDGIKRLLEEANPNIRCISLAADANKVIEESPERLNACQALFVTAADGPLEYHCVRAFCNKNFTCPLIIMWVEPFALFAHAIVINKPQDVFENLFNDNLSFANPAISNSKSFLKREAGCQSTYMPYSGLDIQTFLQRFVKIWDSGAKMEADRNYHFIWAGNLSEAKNLNATISPAYDKMNDYSYRIERID